MAMPLLAQADDFAVGRIQRGEQRRRAVAFVVVRHGRAAALLQRQAGLRAIQRLDLALLVAHNTSACSGGLRYSPTMSSSFSAKCWIVADLEVLTRPSRSTIRTASSVSGTVNTASSWEIRPGRILAVPTYR